MDPLTIMGIIAGAIAAGISVVDFVKNLVREGKIKKEQQKQVIAAANRMKAATRVQNRDPNKGGNDVAGWKRREEALANKGVNALDRGNEGMLTNKPESSLWGGTPAHVQQLPRFTPEQSALMNKLGQMGFESLDPERMDRRAREKFQRETVPGIASQFTAATGGALSSPSLMHQIGAAGANLEENLADLRQKHSKELLALGLKPQFDNKYIAAQPGIGEKIQTSLTDKLIDNIPDYLQKGGEFVGDLVSNALDRRKKTKEEGAASETPAAQEVARKANRFGHPRKGTAAIQQQATAASPAYQTAKSMNFGSPSMTSPLATAPRVRTANRFGHKR